MINVGVSPIKRNDDRDLNHSPGKNEILKYKMQYMEAEKENVNLKNKLENYIEKYK